MRTHGTPPPPIHPPTRTTLAAIRESVERARFACGFSTKIEVECTSEQDAREACAAGADIVMLDNYKVGPLARPTHSSPTRAAVPVAPFTERGRRRGVS